MARKRISLSQFRVEGEMHEPGVDLVHRYRQCDWSEDAYGMTPAEVVHAARGHARECDGKPQRHAERPHLADPGFIPAAWSEQLMAALRENAVLPDAGLEAWITQFAQFEAPAPTVRRQRWR